MFGQFCTGVVDAATMAVLSGSQYSHRRIALRALMDQLSANPDAVGPIVDPEEAWSVLAAAERLDADAVAEILFYPTVGVWLTRALHHTRADQLAGVAWPEMAYLHLIAAAAAVRTGLNRTIRVPIWNGAVSLPTVGHLRIPGSFPLGAAELVCDGPDSRLVVRDRVLVKLYSAPPTFVPARRYEVEKRGLTLRAWVEDRDPYKSFGAPQVSTPPDRTALAEWGKLVDEAWDVLTSYHPGHARELAEGLRALVPIDPDSDVIGSSSPAAYGGIGLSGKGTAVELAEAMVHEMQHSKLNALLGLVRLTEDQDRALCYAPWRDDPRPLIGLVHGVLAFTTGVEFWLRQREMIEPGDLRGIEFAIALRRLQVRRAVALLSGDTRLNPLGRVLIESLSSRLAVCEQASVPGDLLGIAAEVVDDHQTLWRLRFLRPDTSSVDRLAQAWIADVSCTDWAAGESQILPDDGRRLPANRRNLLRAKALEPDLFASLQRRPASLPGDTPLADAALTAGNHSKAVGLYRDHILARPTAIQSWAGLALALRGRGDVRTASALLELPEVTVAAYHRVRLLTAECPDPVDFAGWVASAL